MYKFSFEKLTVWKDAIDFGKLIYQITNTFPSDEKFGLVSQIRRATISISSNIAEGSSRTGIKDQAQFYQIAYSSSMEVLSQLIISKELGFINQDQLLTCRNTIEIISNKINALRKATLRKQV